jgi:ABC-2 type transport system ATP-binding protein
LDPNQIIEIRNVKDRTTKDRFAFHSYYAGGRSIMLKSDSYSPGNILQDCPIDEFKGRFGSLEEAFADYTAVSK